jgi:tripartite-type tricarboxylate transporter receptor subunit TctC
VEEVAAKAGVQMLHVPYKGNADSTQALMGGHVMVQWMRPAGASSSTRAPSGCS